MLNHYNFIIQVLSNERFQSAKNYMSNKNTASTISDIAGIILIGAIVIGFFYIIAHEYIKQKFKK